MSCPLRSLALASSPDRKSQPPSQPQPPRRRKEFGPSDSPAAKPRNEGSRESAYPRSSLHPAIESRSRDWLSRRNPPGIGTAEKPLRGSSLVQRQPTQRESTQRFGMPSREPAERDSRRGRQEAEKAKNLRRARRPAERRSGDSQLQAPSREAGASAIPQSVSRIPPGFSSDYRKRSGLGAAVRRVANERSAAESQPQESREPLAPMGAGILRQAA